MTQFERIRNLVLGARELPESQRAAWLRDQCGQDKELLAAAESLLAHDDSQATLLKTGGATGAIAPLKPERIGAYLIGDRIGEGGFGEVFAAQQLEPIKRSVAVKVLKRGMDTRAVLARFDAERRTLAAMEHPNIARILDAGETDDGRPFFVMDLIRGVPVTEFCRAQGPDRRERLKLFLKICSALRHAHGKGVIHRDLKPSNILVAREDGVPQPRVIDFGIAKALGPDAETTGFTLEGQFVGTPTYMSPEQAAGDPGVGVTTDVYGLGAVLFEMLCGDPPFAAEKLLSQGTEGVSRVLRETETPRPSRRGSSGQTISAELDWIVLTAMAKEPERRYESASALAADVERFLRHEPVAAAPPSWGYRTGKFVRRHRLALTAAVAIFIFLAAFAGNQTIQNKRIAAQRDRAETISGFLADMISTIDPQTMGESLFQDLEARIAETRGDDAAINEWRSLTAGVSSTDLARRLLDRDVLARAALTIDDRLGHDPLTAAQLRATIGRSYRSLGLYEQGEPHLRQALVEQETLLGPGHPTTVNTLNALAQLLEKHGAYAEAESLTSEALSRARDLGDSGVNETLSALGNLGVIHSQIGDMDQAEIVRREAVGLARSALGNDAEITIVAVGSLGLQLQNMGRFDEAEPLLRESAESADKVLGPDHPFTLTALNNLTLVLSSTERFEEAAEVRFRLIQLSSRVLGPTHPETLTYRINYAASLDELGRDTEAAKAYHQVIAELDTVLGPDHPKTLAARYNLGNLYLFDGDPADSEPVMAQVYDGYQRAAGPIHYLTVNAGGSLAEVRRRLGKIEEALALTEIALEAGKQALPEGHWMMGKIMVVHGRCLIGAGSLEDAEASLTQGRDLLVSSLGPDHTLRKMAREGLAELFSARGQEAEAEKWRNWTPEPD